GEAPDQLTCLPRTAEVVIAREGRVDVIVAEQLTRRAGVFGCDEAHLTQDTQRAERDILQVANRRAHQVQRPHRALPPVAKSSARYRERPHDEHTGPKRATRDAEARRPRARREAEVYLVAPRGQCEPHERMIRGNDLPWHPVYAGHPSWMPRLEDDE